MGLEVHVPRTVGRWSARPSTVFRIGDTIYRLRDAGAGRSDQEAEDFDPLPEIEAGSPPCS